ncbi:L-lysine 2,3-aminomutase [Paenibacillus sp. PastH-2]|nr:L-lysine 2,3-aminomutase [Paenibacillus sp. PastF-2]MDF9846113.1 L-lysine 2,3-aminomutase [Paenibacillus sp. PastM-2]MDH6477584.1 L-lysine 2,3-aminomutase [Paenibacillus sp. PastH-2]
MNRPVAGNRDFTLPLEQVYNIVEEAKARTSGLGKRVRLSMSHATGKIEILMIQDGKAYLKYHQSKYNEYGRFMIMDCPKDAEWCDDLPGGEEILTRSINCFSPLEILFISRQFVRIK